MPAPLVSIIINGHNAAATLPATLDSVLAQTYIHWEMIYFDSASTDTSLSIAMHYAAREPRIRCIAHPARPVLGEARNLALTQADKNTAFIAFLDADDLWHPDKLTLQVQAMHAMPHVALMCTDADFFEDMTRKRRIPLPSVFAKSPPPQPEENLLESLICRQHIILSSVLIRADALHIKSPFDPTLQLAGDAALFYSLATTHCFHAIRRVLTHRRLHGHNISTAQGKMHGKGWAYEINYIHAVLQKNIENFHTLYPKASAALHRRAVFHTALQLWQQGQGKKARQTLKQKTLQNKEKALYILSFLPPTLYSSASRLYWRMFRLFY